ncbi:MAG: HDOD domain-containing protein [Pseudomonadota bacterium]|nr:HDOD domain-containing protein [Pseudomonadota bacterium]
MSTVTATRPNSAPANVDPSFRFLQDIAKDLASGDVNFPTFSAATVEVRAALDDQNVNAERLARVISREPLVSAKLVRLANSTALNPAGRPIADVRTAVIRVGHSSVRSVAVAVAFDQLRADRDLQTHRDKAEAAWKHSVQVASLSYVIASKLTRLAPDEAMFAGLVHDIGYFYLLSRTGRYPELESDPHALDEILRGWHPSIGQSVLHSFGLTPAVMEAVGEHEAGPYKMPPRTMRDVVRIANLLADDTNPARDPAAPLAELNEPELAAIIAQSRDQLGSLISALHA